jgi:hypothetical protein
MLTSTSDIVDTTPSDGNVWKMLLGAIDKNFDNIPNITPETGPSISGTQERSQ